MRAQPTTLFALAFGLCSLTAVAPAQVVPEGYSLQTLQRAYQSPSPYPDRSEGLRTEIDVPGALFLQLHFAYAEFERNFDTLKILDGNGLLVEELTGNIRDHSTPTIKGSRALLDIYSDYATGGRGFLVDRIEACLPIAGGAPQPPVRNPTGPPAWVEMPMSVASPSPYPANLYREAFPVVVEGAQAIKLYFDFIDVEPEFDFCDILDASNNQLKRFTGNHTGFWTEAIDGDRVSVALTSDFSVQGAGFRVSKVAGLIRGSGGTSRPPFPAPADGQLAELRYFLGGPQAQQPTPLGAGTLQLQPLGQSPDGFVLIVQGFDSRGRQINSSLLDLRPDVRGDIGTCRETGPGQFLFAASETGGANGSLSFTVPGFTGQIPSVRIAVAGRGGGHRHDRGRDREHGRLHGLVAAVTDSGGRAFPQEGNVYTLEIGHREFARAQIIVSGVDARGGNVPLGEPVQYSVRAPARSLSVLQRPDRALEVIAGDIAVNRSVVDLFIQTRDGRRVSTQLLFRVRQPVPVLARLDVTLTGGDPVDLRTTGLELVGGAAPVDVTVTPYDRHGRVFLPPGLRALAVLSGDPVVTVQDLGECRFRIQPLAAPGLATILFRDGDQIVQSAPVRVTVRLPSYHHSHVLLQQGRQWVELADAPLELSPLGLGQDSCVIAIRNYDELDNVMPPALFEPRVFVFGAGGPGGGRRRGGGRGRPMVNVEPLGNNRYRLASLGNEAVDGLSLVVRAPGAGRGEALLRLPLRVVEPAPVPTTVHILDCSPQPQDLTGSHVRIPLTANGAPGFVDVEVAVHDQFGRKMHGLAADPVFTFPRGLSPVLVRRISEIPSVWRLEPRGQEEPLCSVDITLAGSRLSGALQISVFDPDMVAVGSLRSEPWVKWGLKRDYDFALAAPLRRTRTARVVTSGRFRVDKVFIQHENGLWSLVPRVEASLEAGKHWSFKLPPSKQAITAIRFHGHSDARCEIRLAVRRPRVARGQ